MNIEIESWMTPADVRVLEVFDPLREKAERAMAAGGDVAYWLGYVAGMTDVALEMRSESDTEVSA